MKTSISIASFLALASAGAVASAATFSGQLKGSDTLGDVTQDIVAQCQTGGPASAATTLAPGAFNYAGGGSGTGETAMRNTEQVVSPMSRPFSAANVCNTGTFPSNQSVVVGLDGLALVSSTASASPSCKLKETSFTVTDQNGDGVVSCGSVPGCSSTAADGTPKTYTFSAVGGAPTATFKDVLRVLFAGADSDDAATQTMADRDARCGSDLRKSLVANWSNLVDCAGGVVPSAAQVAMAMRRSDLSGTTDTFIGALGLSAIAPAGGPRVTSTPFCNGLDWEDNDPIRLPCAAGDQACGQIRQEGAPATNPVFLTDGSPTGGRSQCSSATGTRCGADRSKGLVVPVFVPEGATTSSEQAYAAVGGTVKACKVGNFRFARAAARPSTGALTNVCPDGTNTSGVNCLVPLAADNDANCVNADNPATGAANLSSVANGRPIAIRAGSAAYNKVLRVGVATATSTSAVTVAKNELGHDVMGAYYRGAAASCREASSTRQIGCMAASAANMVGFAGVESTTLAGAQPLLVAGVAPTAETVRDGSYLLSRKLFFNSTVGFSAVQTFAGNGTDTLGGSGSQRDLSLCYVGNVAAGTDSPAATGSCTVTQAQVNLAFGVGTTKTPATLTMLECAIAKRGFFAVHLNDDKPFVSACGAT